MSHSPFTVAPYLRPFDFSRLHALTPSVVVLETADPFLVQGQQANAEGMPRVGCVAPQEVVERGDPRLCLARQVGAVEPAGE